jgi:hypothetical protein
MRIPLRLRRLALAGVCCYRRLLRKRTVLRIHSKSIAAKRQAFILIIMFTGSLLLGSQFFYLRVHGNGFLDVFNKDGNPLFTVM